MLSLNSIPISFSFPSLTEINSEIEVSVFTQGQHPIPTPEQRRPSGVWQGDTPNFLKRLANRRIDPLVESDNWTLDHYVTNSLPFRPRKEWGRTGQNPSLIKTANFDASAKKIVTRPLAVANTHPQEIFLFFILSFCVLIWEKGDLPWTDNSETESSSSCPGWVAIVHPK